MIENEIYTGAVRRLDDFYRIVIPKDICEKARIKEGTALEVYYTNAGDIILRPYDFTPLQPPQNRPRKYQTRQTE